MTKTQVEVVMSAQRKSLALVAVGEGADRCAAMESGEFA